MHHLIEELLTAGVIITDGGWGTQFQEKGLPLGAAPDEWNLTDPEKVIAVAKSYVDAGSGIILTNTFGANYYTLKKSGLEAKVAEMNRRGVELSKAAAEGTATKVFASLGPSGIILMMGEVSADELEAAFSVQAENMAAGGADGIVVETMSDPEEAAVAVRAAKKTGLPVVACMVFDSGKNLDRTMMGTTPEQAAETLLAAGADIIGSNCGKGVEGFLPICQRLADASGRKVWIKANRGLPEVRDGKTHYAQTPEQFADFAPALIEAGAGFLGGCCGTSPEFIAALKKKLSE